MASSTNSRIPQIAKVRCRGIVVHCQQPGAFLLKEVRGSQIEYFEPGSIRVRREYAEEAVRSGWLMIRDRDLFGEPTSWAYGPNSSKDIHPIFAAGDHRAKDADAPLRRGADLHDRLLRRNFMLMRTENNLKPSRRLHPTPRQAPLIVITALDVAKAHRSPQERATAAACYVRGSLLVVEPAALWPRGPSAPRSRPSAGRFRIDAPVAFPGAHRSDLARHGSAGSRSLRARSSSRTFGDAIERVTAA